jgi:NACHT domain/Restriction endonuclease
MSLTTTIRILETDNNRKGDLFGRLMVDLFVALGYEQPRLNIHKTGRELDLSANHRLENRRAVAECKATAEPIGGGDLNKFVGALDAERYDSQPLTGYFISLNGFRETAIEQELHRRTKIITLDGQQVVSELVKGRFVIPWDKATELSGRYCGPREELVLDSSSELLAHERGWIWVVYYLQGKLRSHFALIHSDGTPLASAIAKEVVLADQRCGGELYKLTCLNPSPINGTDADIAPALAAYRSYLTNECGFIQLDGLPADTDVGSRRLKLENLFVPLHVDVSVTIGNEKRKVERQQIGVTLQNHRHLAILAAPGGGKSTLVKRLAVAYVDPARRKEIADNLPDNEWLPLFFRCRELRDLSRGSFEDLLFTLSHREPIRQHATAFRLHVDRALLGGQVLLLVDGLDEISDPGDRAAFLCTIRSAVLAYPGTALIVTSREAGFRHVAAHVASLCTQATISLFDEEDIRRLSVGWHREVVGDSERVRLDAEQLATTIVKSDRIKRLAVNPLLLTTLLLVKRWVGSLPTRRAALYGKAVEVLLMTWNTEGHEPISHEEALPQLCYVASAMMLAGEQKISRPRLASLLQESRNALPTELGYVEGTVDQFIHRVEDRSSLLMMSGHDVESGQLVEFFEFRHLTFQEFLTARAMVEGWHQGRQETDTLVSVLEPHFTEGEWSEVIPLAASLGGKSTEGLIQRLTERVMELGELGNDKGALLLALTNCLADECAARPDTIRAAVREIVRFGSNLLGFDAAPMLARGKYGRELRHEASQAFLLGGDNPGHAGDALIIAVWWQTLETDDAAGYAKARDQFIRLLDSPQIRDRIEGALGLGRLSYDLFYEKAFAVESSFLDTLRSTKPLLSKMLFQREIAECGAASYAFAAMLLLRLWRPTPGVDLLERFFRLWKENPETLLGRLALRALSDWPIVRPSALGETVAIDKSEIESLLERYETLNKYEEQPSTLILAWYLEALDDAEIARRAKVLIEMKPHSPSLRELLEVLGQSPETN